MLAALATAAWLTVSGHAEHFEQARYNEENYGLGFDVGTWSAGVLKDSNGNWSPYAATRWDFAERGEWAAGVALTATYRQSHPQGNYTGFRIGPLPYARWESDNIGVNITAAPVDGGFIFFQIKFRLSE